jgi:hypothetical protein
MRNRSAFAAAAFLATSLLATSAWGATRVFGRVGETVSVIGGTYGTLFPGGSAATPTDPVLALEIRNTLSGSVERLLVPGTADARLEFSPSIVFEPTAERTYLVWEARANAIHSQILIGSYGADGWSDPIEVNNGSSFVLKGSPQVAVSRDRFVEVVDGESLTHTRTVVHVVWWQESGLGARTIYAPVTIVDGFAPELITAFDLSELDGLLDLEAGGTAGSALPWHPALLAGRDELRAVVAFIGANSGRLTGIELEVLPREIADLADKARGHIIDLAAGPAQSRPEMAQSVRTFIAQHAVSFPPVVAALAAEQVSALVLGAGADQPAAELADRARGHIIDLLESPTLGELAPGTSDAVGALFAAPDPRAESLSPHLFAVREVHTWSVPSGLPDAAFPVLSKDAQAAAIAWPCGDDAICFVEHEAGAWSAGQQLPLQGMSLGDAASLVRERLDRH